jgi:excisionase family DNA binding protein
MDDTSKERATLSISEAAKLLGIGRNQAYQAAHRGEIPTLKIGSRLLVPRAALAKMLHSEA